MRRVRRASRRRSVSVRPVPRHPREPRPGTRQTDPNSVEDFRWRGPAPGEWWLCSFAVSSGESSRCWCRRWGWRRCWGRSDGRGHAAGTTCRHLFDRLFLSENCIIFLVIHFKKGNRFLFDFLKFKYLVEHTEIFSWLGCFTMDEKTTVLFL